MSIAFLIAAAGISITSSSQEAVELFRAGRDKALNFQEAEAADFFRKALAADDHFALALAWLGKVTPGPQGVAELENAVREAAPLSPAERKSVEVLLAERKGEDEKVRNLKREIADLAPGDWLAQFQLGAQSMADHKSQAAMLYLKRAIALNPKAAEAYNYLAYVLAQQGQMDEAIGAVQKFVELKPREPNSHDSLGEVLMMAGRYGEAEQAFERSAAMANGNWMSWMGVAYARFLRGNFDGGREAAMASRKFITRAPDMLAVDECIAWSYLAQGQGEAALRELDRMERDAAARKDDFGVAWSAFERAEMLQELDRAVEALKQLDEARARGEKATITGADRNRLRREALVLQARIGALQASPQHSERALQQLEQELQGAPSNADLRGMVHYVRGLVALAHGDARSAAEQLALCPDNAWRCRLDLMSAQQKAGFPAAADATRERILKANVRDNLHQGRDPAYLYVSARLKASRGP